MNWNTFIMLLVDNAVKYLLIATPIFLIFYVFLKKKIAYKKIQLNYPNSKEYIREIGFSTLSIIIFSIPPLLLLFNENVKRFTTYYNDVDDYGVVYLIVAFPIMLLIHDTYFYWMHRLMHLPMLYRRIHLVHHKSINPSPWAAYAFHPLEAILESLIFVVFLFTIPIHEIHLMSFFVFSLLYNVYGHLGFELYPKNFNQHWLGKWLNTSVGHNQHHQFFTGNYGLYFTIWDRAMGTLRPDYDKAYESLQSREK